ncbi:MAG: oxygen-independent coproporphyrinogen oxidase [Pseudomonadota bacterium]|jgi:oxygen-independent coproporphyrinogen-3 oxidase
MSALIDEQTLAQFDVPGPRYTSYPTADRFVEAFGESDYQAALQLRRQTRSQAPLSLYVHLPFCESVCYYCACNKVVTKNRSKAEAYLHDLALEIDLQTQYLGEGQRLSQLHFGGGTPTYYSDEQLQGLMAVIRRKFELVPGGEYSIEVDPRTISADRLKSLLNMGFGRLSFGVQDFDPVVQRAVHRVQPYADVERLMQTARGLGFDSINLDLIYGLPMQTPESMAKTVEAAIALGPDRVALYGYAHLPARFKPQRRINEHELPRAKDKVHMLASAIEQMERAGYVYIGMDHFAKPNDALAVARSQGRLHRNFQGYSTQPDCDLIALGVSAIGRVGNTYSQNAKTLEEYSDALHQGRLPIVKGMALGQDDVLRRAVIMSIMCQGKLDFDAIRLGFGVDVERYFERELEALTPLARAGLVECGNDEIRVTERGWYVVRAVAMGFDRYLQGDAERQRFSKII